MTLTRRDLLFFGLKKKAQSEPNAKSDAWYSIGRTADLPPGVVLAFEIEKTVVEVISTYEGLYAWTRGEQRRWIPLKYERGEYFINPNGEWPMGSALSIMTGEKIQIHNHEGSQP